MSQGEDSAGPSVTKERLAGAIKVGFAQWRVDYTETVFDELICLERDGESQHAAIGKYHVKSLRVEFFRRCLRLHPAEAMLATEASGVLQLKRAVKTDWKG